MKSFTSPSGSVAARALESTLTVGERVNIGFQLGTSMLSVGLLLVGFAIQYFAPVEQNSVAELCKAFAAVVVIMPMFVIAVRGLFKNDLETQGKQLVVLASCAALATGQFTTAALIPIIMNLCHFLEERSVLGAQEAIKGLKTLQSRSACLVTPDGEKEVELSELCPGSIIVVRPGEVIAVDGQVIEGHSSVNQSSITGESTPDEVAPGSRVFAGSINLSGVVRVEVSQTGSGTALGRVVDLLRNAEQSKTHVLKIVERYAGYLTIIILIIAAIVLFATRDLSRAITILVVGCPGPFILAGPSAMVAALATCSRLGILIKNSKFLETLADVDTVVFFKKRTLDQGEHGVVKVNGFDGCSEPDLFKYALPGAVGSRHPISRAVAEAAKERGVVVKGRSQVTEVPGKGVLAVQKGAYSTYLGRGDWLADEGFSLPPSPDHLGSTVWLGQIESGKKPRVLGYFLLADTPKPEARQTIEELKTMGVERSLLLTGDRKTIAQSVGGDLRVDEVVAEALPEQKLEVVKSEVSAGRTVMVVGDGINDALALASGDVGVAMGATGISSDIAMKSADVVLTNAQLDRLPKAISLSRQTRTIIHQNVLLGAGITMIMLLLAASGIISPLLGVIVHNFAEVGVILNSARLLKSE
ncbi:MAG: cation-translocating P-type ATPase [Verrucomicrobiota bacterium]